MPLTIEHETIDLHFHHPFQLARGKADAARQTVLVRIREPNGDATSDIGLGEATPIRYMGESLESVCQALDAFSIPDEADWRFIGSILRRFDIQFPGRRAARAAIDFAQHDRMGKNARMPVYELLGLRGLSPPITSFTIGMADPDVIREKVHSAEPYAILKVKLGSPDDWDTLRLIRSLTDKVIRVDANEGWEVDQAIDMARQLADFGVELVEQPVPRGDLDGLAAVTEASPIPVIADESCQVLSDISRLSGKAHGINVKLMKCGGISEGLKMIHAARALNMKVMIGCMIETSIGITAAAHLSPLVDYADLDGNILIRNDPFVGVIVEDGRLKLPNASGLGVTER